MKLRDLFINHVPNEDVHHPWHYAETRTFHCSKCKHTWTIPEDALKCYMDEEEMAFTVSTKFLNGLCPRCKQANYELMSFMRRYGLIAHEPKPKPIKPLLTAGFDFEEEEQ